MLKTNLSKSFSFHVSDQSHLANFRRISKSLFHFEFNINISLWIHCQFHDFTSNCKQHHCDASSSISNLQLLKKATLSFSKERPQDKCPIIRKFYVLNITYWLKFLERHLLPLEKYQFRQKTLDCSKNGF